MPELPFPLAPVDGAPASALILSDIHLHVILQHQCRLHPAHLPLVAEGPQEHAVSVFGHSRSLLDGFGLVHCRVPLTLGLDIRAFPYDFHVGALMENIDPHRCRACIGWAQARVQP